jgi:hypothetical protein
VEKGDFIDFILDADVEKVMLHLEEITKRFEVKEGEGYAILRVWKEKDIEEAVEGDIVEVDEKTNVGKLIEMYPETVEVLASYGFTPLKNPVLRKTLAKTISLGRAKMLKGLSDEEFEEMLEKLREIVGRK